MAVVTATFYDELAPFYHLIYEDWEAAVSKQGAGLTLGAYPWDCASSKSQSFRGQPWVGRKGISEMAAGFFADVPDLQLVCDEVRCAGDHVAYFWNFTGTHAATKNPLRVVGWEEWDLNADSKVIASRGWYDASDYERQTTAR